MNTRQRQLYNIFCIGVQVEMKTKEKRCDIGWLNQILPIARENSHATESDSMTPPDVAHIYRKNYVDAIDNDRKE
jgi:hypothetical protein